MGMRAEGDGCLEERCEGELGSGLGSGLGE